MSIQNRLISLKQLISLGAIASVGAFLGLPALAQSNINPDATNPDATHTVVAQAPTADDFELSPEGFEILCERFPLNSRCDGTSSTEGNGLSGGPADPETDVTAPARGPGNTPSDDSSGGIQERPGESMDDMTPPGSTPDGTLTPPGTNPQGAPLDNRPPAAEPDDSTLPPTENR
jgi:hypothetical protein